MIILKLTSRVLAPKRRIFVTKFEKQGKILREMVSLLSNPRKLTQIAARPDSPAAHGAAPGGASVAVAATEAP